YEVTNEQMVPLLNALTGSLHVVMDEDQHFPRYVRFNAELGGENEFLLDIHPKGSGIVWDGKLFHVRPGYQQVPVVQVTWHGARLYCATRGKRLPTEHEWEAAARGRNNRAFPWGDNLPQCGQVILPNDGAVPFAGGCPTQDKVPIAAIGTAIQDV